MSRKAPSAESLKLLYSRSGNQCAFPECPQPIFDDEGDYVAELCHINAANEGGERYDINQTDGDRRSYNNLLFLCHRHHVKTNNTNKYSTEVLYEIKKNHESNYTESGRMLSKAMFRSILIESELYWKKQTEKTFEHWDLKMHTDFNQSIFDLLRTIESQIKRIEDYADMCASSDSSLSIKNDMEELFKKANLDYTNIEQIPCRENPFSQRNWEMHNIGRPNFFNKLKLSISQLKVLIAEETLKNDPENNDLKALVQKFRDGFEDQYDNSYHAD